MKKQLLKNYLFAFALFASAIGFAQTYNFNTATDAQGYSGVNAGTSVAQIENVNGTGRDVIQWNHANLGSPTFKADINVNASTNKTMRIVFQNNSNANSFRIRNSNVAPWVGTGITPNSTDWQTLTIDITGLANFTTDGVYELRQQFRNNNIALSGDIFIDEVEFYDPSAPCTTAADVSNFTVTDAGATQLDLSWTDSTCFDEVLVVAKATSAVTVTPTGDGTAYTADATFGTTGTDTNLASGEYAVFNGSGNSVSVTGLTSGTAYHFEVFARKGMTWSTGIIGNGTPTTPPFISFEEYAGAEEADATTMGTIEPNANGNNSVTGWFFQDLDYSFSDVQKATGDYSIKFDSDGLTGTPFNAFLGSSSAIAGSHVVVSGQKEISLKVFIVSNPPSTFRTSLTDNADPAVVNQNNIDWDVTSILPAQYNTWVTLKQIVTFDNYTDARLQIRIDASNMPGGQTVMYFDDIAFKDLKISVADGQWDEIATWGGVLPLTTDSVVIAHEVVIDSDVVCDIVLIDDTNGKIDVEAGSSLTINRDFTTSNDVYLKSTSSTFASLIVNGTINGQVAYNRFISATPTNDLISPPVEGLTFGGFLNTYIRNNLHSNYDQVGGIEGPADGLTKLFGPYINSSGTYQNYIDGSADDNEVLIQGKGYRAATVSGIDLRFKGNSSTSSIGIALTDESGSNASGAWNLIGNPYPSYLDFTTFFDDNKPQFDPVGAFQAVYGYNGAASGSKWIAYNNITSPPDGKITPGQGFFVKSKSGGSTTDVTFTPAMRVNGSGDDFISGRNAGSKGSKVVLNKTLAKLQLSNATDTFSTDVYFVDNQTRGLDPGYDAGAYQGNSGGIFTHLVADNTGIEMAIQALPTNDFNDVVVPLGVKSAAGVQITIGLDAATATIPSSVNVYLEDNVANTWTLLNTADYVFTPSVELNGVGRFFVHFSAVALSTEDNVLNGLSIYTMPSLKTLVVKGQISNNSTLSLYDLQGRLVLAKDLENTNSNTINVSKLSTGIYVVKVDSGNKIKTQKVIIK